MFVEWMDVIKIRLEFFQINIIYCTIMRTITLNLFSDTYLSPVNSIYDNLIYLTPRFYMPRLNIAPMKLFRSYMNHNTNFRLIPRRH